MARERTYTKTKRHVTEVAWKCDLRGPPGALKWGYRDACGDEHAGRGDEHAGRNERVVEHGVVDVDGGGEGR
jgi:hypothetical protein